MKLKKYHKLIIAADGSAASGKTTGAKKISKKYGLQFLSSGLLYRYASFQLLKYKPKNFLYLAPSFSALLCLKNSWVTNKYLSKIKISS